MITKIKNRRPKLKREPTLADKVAETVRQAGDDLGARVKVYVILYKRSQDFVNARVPKNKLLAIRRRVTDYLESEDLLGKVTFEPYRPNFEVWLHLEEDYLWKKRL